MKTDKAVAPISLVDKRYPSFKEIKGLSFDISIVMYASDLTDDDMLQRQADAERIVTSWNAHDALVKLVKDAQAILAGHLPPGGPSERVTLSDLFELLDGPQARAALAKAGAA